MRKNIRINNYLELLDYAKIKEELKDENKCLLDYLNFHKLIKTKKSLSGIINNEMVKEIIDINTILIEYFDLIRKIKLTKDYDFNR